MPNSSVLDDPGYTPSRKELGMVFDWLLEGDEATAKQAERALVSAGATTIRLALERLARSSGEARVRLARFLGRLAQTQSDSNVDAALSNLLSDADDKVVRAAVVAFGKLSLERARSMNAEAVLLELLPRVQGAERRALVESLGKVGGGLALERLRDLPAEGDTEAQLLERAKLRLERATVALAETDRVRLDVDLERPCDIAILHRRGLSEIVARQVGGLGVVPSDGPERRVLRDYRGNLLRLFLASRSMLAPAIVVEFERPAREEHWSSAVVGTLCQPFLLEILERLSTTKPRLRFVVAGAGHQRALLWSISENLAKQTSRVQANPRAALWEVTLERGAVPKLLIEPKRFDDPRFAYRVREISGASHPTIAAALAELVAPRQTDVIWDPFVGSGLELIECAKRGQYRELIGSDNNPRALEAASANVRAAELERVRLLNADARTAQPKGVTAIVTNPPLGIRHQRDGQLGPLLIDFLTNARKTLSSEGRLVWLSPFPRNTAEHAKALGFRVERVGPVDVGGLAPELQILRLGRAK